MDAASPGGGEKYQPVPIEMGPTFWEQLLGIIAKGNVVPVVGEDLLRLPGDGRNLYDALSERCCPTGDPSFGLSRIALNRDFRNNRRRVYSQVFKDYENLNPPIPETLRALARIRDFHLFVSITLDNLLERALNEEHGADQTRVIRYSYYEAPTDSQIEDCIKSKRPIVFQMFGQFSHTDDFALTDGDKVEYLWGLQSDGRPNRILSELWGKPLLILGNSLPDWLTPVFLRVLRKQKLDHSDCPEQYMSEGAVSRNPRLRFFFENFALNTTLVDRMDPAEFVLELSRRWKAAKASGKLQAPPEPEAMPKDAVFISYCGSDPDGNPSRDRTVAREIYSALQNRGIPAWFDKTQLHPGDDWDRVIRRYVNNCLLFLPIISKTSVATVEGYFRKEWHQALQRVPAQAAGVPFLFPVYIDKMDIDEVDAESDRIPKEFDPVHRALLKGVPDDDFIDDVKRAYAKASRERNG